MTSLDGFMIGSPSSESFLVPQLSNHGSPTHSASMCITEDCVMMFSILSPPTSTTGRLFILYLDRSSNMVRNVSDVCSARNGAHRKLPEISPTYSGTICVQFVPRFQVITNFQYSATEDHLCILVELRGSEGFEKTSTNRCSFI